MEGLEKGGGKSFLLCLWVVEWCIWLIKFWELERTSHPLPVGFIGRKRSVDFSDTTLETFKKIIPSEVYRIREQDKEIIIDETVKIAYGGLDDQDAINKFNSAEFAFMAIDQAEETGRKDVSVLQASLRLRHKFKTPPYKELYTANPAECWLKEDFILQNRTNGVFIPALPDDNPYLPDNYKQTLRDSFAYDPCLLRAYLDGDWDAFSNVEDAVFSPIWFERCRKVEDDSDEEYDTKTVASDVATKRGDNFTVVGYRVGNTPRDVKQWKNLATTQTALEIKKMWETYKPDSVVVDSDGFGEGVADVLASTKIGVTEFHGGYSVDAIDKRRFKNLRTQFYVITARKLEKGMICLKHLPQDIYEKMKAQACSIKYRKPDPLMRYQIESKEDMRARGIMSPDLIDWLVYSEYGIFMGKKGDMVSQGYAYR